MEEIKNLLKDPNNKNILRIDFDQVENKKYYQYRFKFNNNNLDFKYYIDNNQVSQIYINSNEYLGFYKINIIDEILKNINVKINTDKYLIK